MSISRPRHFNEIKSEGGGGITPEQQATIDANTEKITSNWTINGDDIYSSNSGNVGIGTMTPTSKLDIKDGTLKVKQETGDNDNCLIINPNNHNNGVDIECFDATNANKKAICLNSYGGYVGIGTPTPLCPLHVTGIGGQLGTQGDLTGNLVYFNRYHTGLGAQSAHNLATNANQRTQTSIYASKSIASGFFFVSSEGVFVASDSRIKNNIQDIDDSTALNILRQLKPKTYGYNDFVVRGSDEVVGFIAQEVKELIPSGVSITTQFLPNIYCVSAFGAEGVVEFDTNKMITGDNVTGRISLRDKNDEEQILEVGDYTVISTGIQVSKDISEYVGDNNEIFVYGQEVNDFNLLKKESIFTLATAALQEVDRQLQAEKAKTATLETTVADLVARITALENA